MVLNAAFWAGRRVLLTGHTGFKGAWAARWLARLGAHVTGLSLAPEGEPNLFALLKPTLKVDSRFVDLREEAEMRLTVTAADPEIVIHMAAQALLPRSFREPVETWSSNVVGTVILLDALRSRRALKAVVVVTSDKVYAGADGNRAFIESDPLGGDDPYSASKAATEIAVAAWRKSIAAAGPPIATARAGNVIGGGDWAEDRLIPDLMRAAAAGQPLELRNPDATRPWQHVLDPVAGYLLYAERLAAGAAVPPALNFGPAAGETRAAHAVVERISNALGIAPDWRHAPRPEIRERARLALDSTLAQRSLGWRPRLAIDAALDWTAEWYAGFGAGKSAAALTDAQIARYEALP